MVNGSIIATNRSTPYLIYENTNPFFREYDQSTWTYSNYSNMTETLWMKPEQVQDCQANDFSDSQWGLTSESKDELKIDLGKSLNKPQPNEISNFSLEFDMTFERAQPATAKVAKSKFFKTLNFSLQPDCIAGKMMT